MRKFEGTLGFACKFHPSFFIHFWKFSYEFHMNGIIAVSMLLWNIASHHNNNVSISTFCVFRPCIHLRRDPFRRMQVRIVEQPHQTACFSINLSGSPRCNLIVFSRWAHSVVEIERERERKLFTSWLSFKLGSYRGNLANFWADSIRNDLYTPSSSSSGWKAPSVCVCVFAWVLLPRTRAVHYITRRWC